MKSLSAQIVDDLGEVIVFLLPGVEAGPALLQQLQQQPQPGHVLLALLGLALLHLLPDLGRGGGARVQAHLGDHVVVGHSQVAGRNSSDCRHLRQRAAEQRLIKLDPPGE